MKKENKRSASSKLAKRARLATGMSQTEYAKELNIPVGTIRNWEQSRRELRGPALALVKLILKYPHVITDF